MKPFPHPAQERTMTINTIDEWITFIKVGFDEANEKFCDACGRSVEACDDDPTTTVDCWDYEEESHYTRESYCEGYRDRFPPDEPDYDYEPDYDGP
jgi:hypothetical protein